MDSIYLHSYVHVVNVFCARSPTNACCWIVYTQTITLHANTIKIISSMYAQLPLPLCIV